MEYLISSVTNFFIGRNESNEITGYILDNTNTNKVYILTKESDIYWRTKWVDKSIKIIEPSVPIRKVFCP
jgi:hypothetical protein